MPALLAPLLAKLGLNVSEAFIRWLFIGLCVVTIVTCGLLTFKHVENNRAALVAEAKSSAVSDLRAKIADATAKMIEKQTADMQRRMDQETTQVSKDQASWDATFSKIDELPLDATAGTPAGNPAPASPASPSLVQPVGAPHAPKSDPAAPVRRLDARLNRLLERSSAF